MMGVGKKRILIYRLGSLGDTIVSLPALRLVQRSYPQAERWMLTNFSASSKAAPMARVLEGTGPVHGYIEYPLGLRDPRGLLRLRQEIHRLGPDVLIYLAAPRGRLKALRDAVFFRACGIPRLIGVPYSKTYQHPLKLADDPYANPLFLNTSFRTPRASFPNLHLSIVSS